MESSRDLALAWIQSLTTEELLELRERVCVMLANDSADKLDEIHC